MRQFGFKASRNREQKKKRACGCSIVAKALNKEGLKNERGKNWTERAVEEVEAKVRKGTKDRHLKHVIALLCADQKPAATDQKTVAMGMFGAPPEFVPD